MRCFKYPLFVSFFSGLVKILNHGCQDFIRNIHKINVSPLPLPPPRGLRSTMLTVPPALLCDPPSCGCGLLLLSFLFTSNRARCDDDCGVVATSGIKKSWMMFDLSGKMPNCLTRCVCVCVCVQNTSFSSFSAVHKLSNFTRGVLCLL